MTVSGFTKPELDYFRENCNFTDLESQLFEGRAKGMTLDEIAEMMNISRDWAGKLSQKVNKKILKVL